jgi:hypothetical protein
MCSTDSTDASFHIWELIFVVHTWGGVIKIQSCKNDGMVVRLIRPLQSDHGHYIRKIHLLNNIKTMYISTVGYKFNIYVCIIAPKSDRI